MTMGRAQQLEVLSSRYKEDINAWSLACPHAVQNRQVRIGEPVARVWAEVIDVKHLPNAGIPS